MTPGLSLVWFKAWLAYLQNRTILDTFVFCLDPISDDTGGLLLHVRLAIGSSRHTFTPLFARAGLDDAGHRKTRSHCRSLQLCSNAPPKCISECNPYHLEWAVRPGCRRFVPTDAVL